MYVMLFKPNAKFIPCRMVYKQVDQDIPAQHLRMGQQVRQSARGWVNWGTLSALSSHRIWRFCLLMMGPSSSPWSTRKWIGEPHRLYYVCHLQETFRRDTAEMAPCWLYLVASHFYNRTHEDDWSVTIDPSVLSLPAHMQARFLTAQAYWPAFWLCTPLTSLKSGRPVYITIERLTNGSTVNNRALHLFKVSITKLTGSPTTPLRNGMYFSVNLANLLFVWNTALVTGLSSLWGRSSVTLMMSPSLSPLICWGGERTPSIQHVSSLQFAASDKAFCSGRGRQKITRDY